MDQTQHLLRVQLVAQHRAAERHHHLIHQLHTRVEETVNGVTAQLEETHEESEDGVAEQGVGVGESELEEEGEEARFGMRFAGEAVEIGERAAEERERETLNDLLLIGERD